MYVAPVPHTNGERYVQTESRGNPREIIYGGMIEDRSEEKMSEMEERGEWGTMQSRKETTGQKPGH